MPRVKPPLVPSVAALCRGLCDPTRLRLLARIGRGEVCVCDLQAEVGRDQPTVSRHLAMLLRCGLVVRRRQGRWSYYRRAPLPRSLSTIVDLAAPPRGSGRRACC
jgi:ArsR family transcriptional regulator